MIYYRVSQYIKKDGRSYRELAKMIDVSYRTLALLATSKNQKDIVISVTILDKLCKFFKAQPADLIYYKKK